MVHVSAPDDLPRDLVSIPADLPDDLGVQWITVAELPRDWRRAPAPPALADIGTAWLTAARTPVLAVPSAVVPQETNHILNPHHPDFRRIAIGRLEPFELDPRLGPRERAGAGRGPSG
jgi:RES domain-containing protein